MKICFLAGANSIHSYRWIKFFADKGYEVHWISLVPNIFGNIKGVEFYRFREFPAKPLDILFNAIPVRKLIRKINPDILHAHYAGVNGVLGALSGFHPFVLTAWGSDILIVSKNRLVKLFIKFALKKADLITCDAEHMKEAMIELGADSSKIKIVYFGVDIRKFSPGLRDEKLIEKLKIQNCPAIISLRNFDPIYNLETLIKSIPLVLKEVPEAKFIIAGRGPEEEKLKNFAKNLKVLESIRFVGWISNEELPAYLRTVDIYVSTSLSDAGIASSTTEAMACGLPVVITNAGENDKWIDDGENGFLVGAKNPRALAEKMVVLLRNRILREKFGAEARETVMEKNDYYREMEKMEKIYQNLI